MSSLFDPVAFTHGPAMKNRFMLAPLTNLQSHVDGTLSEDEYHWLTMRALGGFGLTMTCASHVQAQGQGFPGQLGCFRDDHLPGLTRLASGIKEHGSLAIVQLHHAGRRSPVELIHTTPVCPSDDESTGARALTTAEVEQLVEDFVAAAVRCERAGFDGVELHGAHDYVICEFLSSQINVRTDKYGGSVENRARLLLEILDGVRAECREDFNVSVRLSPELFSLHTPDIVATFELVVATGQVDFIDMSLWNVFNIASDPAYGGVTLLELFAGLERGNTRLAVAGKLYDSDAFNACLEAGVDMVALGRAAITNHNIPELMRDHGHFAMRALPVPRATLREEGLSDTFVEYMSSWRGFVEEAVS